MLEHAFVRWPSRAKTEMTKQQSTLPGMAEKLCLEKLAKKATLVFGVADPEHFTAPEGRRLYDILPGANRSLL